MPPLGWIQDLDKEFKIRATEGGPWKGSMDLLPQTFLQIEVLGNGISGILRPSQHLLISHILNLGGSTELT